MGRHSRPLEDIPALDNLTRAREHVQTATMLLEAVAFPDVVTLQLPSPLKRQTTLVWDGILPTSAEVVVQTVEVYASVSVHTIHESRFEDP